MNLLLRLFLLLLTSLSLFSCGKSDGLKAKDEENQFSGRWKQTLGITKYYDDVDAYVPDTDVILIIENNGVASLRYDRKEWYGGKQVLRTYLLDGRYSLLHRWIEIQDQDDRDVYDQYRIEELTNDRLKISISYKGYDQLQLFFEKQ